MGKFQPIPNDTTLNRRYRILHLIKAGGMGATYRAEDLILSRECAVKQMLDTFPDQEERQTGIRNFLAEIQLLKGLIHPNIPRITDHFLEQQSFFFVMEYVRGVDLTSLLEVNSRIGFSQEEVVSWGAQVLGVLQYLHSLSPPVIHRDIKPSNLLLESETGRLFLIDFGIARVARPAAGMMIGTPGYSPPEQHENYVEPRSDLYALGVTLHELLTGIRPPADSFDLTPILQIRPEVSPELEEIIMKAAALSLEERYPSAAEMLLDLERFLPGGTSLSGRMHLLPGQSGGSEVRPDRSFQFSLILRDFEEQLLLPLLEETRAEYLNECLTQWIPREFDYLEFAMGDVSPFLFIIQAAPEEESVRFFEKEGILEKRLLGSINIGQREEWDKARGFLSQFLSHYQSFKGGTTGLTV